MAQLRFATMPGGANSVSLDEAQRNYLEFGVAQRSRLFEARSPVTGDERDPQWRPLDAAQDNVEEPMRGIAYADSYPVDDTTVLYYWRPTYWRRFSA